MRVSSPDPTRAAHANQQSADELLPQVYEQLRQLARARLAALAPGQTLQATSLVHDAYVRLTAKGANWDDPRHFLFAAARAMHDIIVEHHQNLATRNR